MMKSRILTLCLAILFLFGCSAMEELTRVYHVDERVDEFDDYKQYEQKYNWCKIGLSTSFALNLKMRHHVSGEKAYFIAVYREGPSWFHFQKEPLEIKADEKKFSFPYMSEQSNVFSAEKLQELAIFRADIESIKKIMEAERLLIRIYGADGFQTIECKP